MTDIPARSLLNSPQTGVTMSDNIADMNIDNIGTNFFPEKKQRQ